jgi:hypothetical protein
MGKCVISNTVVLKTEASADDVLYKYSISNVTNWQDYQYVNNEDEEKSVNNISRKEGISIYILA